MNIEQFDLKRHYVAIGHKISDNLLEPQASIVMNKVMGCMELEIRGYVWAQDGQTIDIEYPRDWREAFKQRWFPAWAKKRWPVVTVRHVINADLLYPNIRILMPKEQHFLRLNHHKSCCTYPPPPL